jgi:hypothetical protein
MQMNTIYLIFPTRNFIFNKLIELLILERPLLREDKCIFKLHHEQTMHKITI